VDSVQIYVRHKPVRPTRHSSSKTRKMTYILRIHLPPFLSAEVIGCDRSRRSPIRSSIHPSITVRLFILAPECRGLIHLQHLRVSRILGVVVGPARLGPALTVRRDRLKTDRQYILRGLTRPHKSRRPSLHGTRQSLQLNVHRGAQRLA